MQKSVGVPENNGDEQSDNFIFTEIDIHEVADKIVQDMKDVKLETSAQIAKAKNRIANILKLYNKTPEDQDVIELEIEEKPSERDLEDIRYETHHTISRSITNLSQMATLDTKFIKLYDSALAEETKHKIRKEVLDKSMVYLKDQANDHLHQTKTHVELLTTAAKSALEDRITFSQSKTSGLQNGHSLFEASDLKTKKQIEQTKDLLKDNLSVLLTNPAGKKTIEELESEAILKETLMDFQRRLKNDISNEKEVLDRTVQNIKDKVGRILNKFQAPDECGK